MIVFWGEEDSSFVGSLVGLIIVAALLEAFLNFVAKFYIQLGIFVVGAVFVTIFLVKKTKKNRGHIAASQLILPTVSIAVLAFIVLIPVLAGSPTVNPLDFMSISFSGYDGAGVATAKLSEKDLDRMETYYATRIQFNSESKEDGELYLSKHGYESPFELLSEYIKKDDEYGFYLDQDSGLSNGDTVTLHWTFFGKSDEVAELMSHLDGKLDCPDIELTVSGLETPPVTSLSEIPGTGMVEIQSEGERIFRESVESEWDSNERTVESVSFIGYWFLIKSDLSANQVYPVYDVHAVQYGIPEDGDQADYAFTYYWTVGFNDIYLTDDGKLFVNYNDCIEPVWFGSLFSVTTYDIVNDLYHTLSYEGYHDLEEMYQNRIITELDDCSLESTIPYEISEEAES